MQDGVLHHLGNALGGSVKRIGEHDAHDESDGYRDEHDGDDDLFLFGYFCFLGHPTLL